MNISILCLMSFEENEIIDNETTKKIKWKKNKCSFNNKEEKESTEMSHKDPSSFYPSKEMKEGRLCSCPCEECLSVCPWCVCTECVSLWGVPSPVCAPQHGQCAPKGTADPFGGLKDRRTRLLPVADGQHRTPRVHSARTRVGKVRTHSVRESVDAVVWSEGGVRANKHQFIK